MSERGQYGVQESAPPMTPWVKWTCIGVVALGGFFIMRPTVKALKDYQELLNEHHK